MYETLGLRNFNELTDILKHKYSHLICSHAAFHPFRFCDPSNRFDAIRFDSPAHNHLSRLHCENTMHFPIRFLLFKLLAIGFTILGVLSSVFFHTELPLARKKNNKNRGKKNRMHSFKDNVVNAMRSAFWTST